MELPATFEPQLATLVDKPRPGEWLYEIKFDGYRMLARVDGTDVRIVTRRGNDWTARFKRLRQELAKAKLPPGWYDGEIVMLDAEGKPNFNLLQNAIDGGHNDRIVFYLFDAPFLAGRDMRRRPVEERRAALQRVLTETPLLRFSQEIPEGAIGDIIASACAMGLEGVIGKRRGSVYLSRRTDDWIKLKCSHRQEFVIGGYTWPDNSRSDPGIGALLVGCVDDGGTLHYAGKVGTGYSGEMSARLRRELDAIAQPKRPFAGPTGHDRHAQWVQPRMVCEVEYREWPEGGSLRHASFKGLREDKPAPAVVRERPMPATRMPAKLPKTAKLTHPERVLDPTTGFTKLHLARYYAEVARWALPHLKARHTFVRRAPEGVTADHFFEEHPTGLGLPGTDPALWPGHEPAFLIETAQALVACAQHAIVELHTWNSTAEDILHPDRVIFDLDPGRGVAWAAVQEDALLVRTLLQELGLQCWLKTTGGKGLHIVVPVIPEVDFPMAKGFALAVAKHLAKTIPQRFVARSGEGNRMGKVFVDYLRNGQSQTTAAAFSPKARPGMGVSMPVSWKELPDTTGAADWNIETALHRLAGLKRDPWTGYWKCRQSLGEAIERIGAAPVK